MKKINTSHDNTTNKNRTNEKNIATVKRQNTFEYLIVNLVCLFLFLAFAYIAVMSIFQTSVFDPTAYGAEKIIFQTDNIALNIFMTVLFAVFVFKMKKHYDFFAKVNMRF